MLEHAARPSASCPVSESADASNACGRGHCGAPATANVDAVRKDQQRLSEHYADLTQQQEERQNAEAAAHRRSA